MTTLTLVLSSTLTALLVAIPAGILAGLSAGLNKTSDVVLDLIQTVPAYIYLLPGIALLGHGPATGGQNRHPSMRPVLRLAENHPDRAASGATCSSSLPET